MKMPKEMPRKLLAPCGVNCIACSAYLDTKKPCPGCRAPAEMHKRKSCINCAKKKCAGEMGVAWCFACRRFPCGRIKRLNKSYTANYSTDLVRDGMAARTDLDAFLQAQQARLTCTCGGIFNQHKGYCSECGKPYKPNEGGAAPQTP